MASVSRPIDGVDLSVMLCTGADSIEHELPILNQLNVFPVPDADTGTNMLHTVKHGVQGLDSIADSGRRSVGIVASRFARGAFAGARGNSGVILAEFLRGIAEGLSGHDILTGSDFVSALDKAATQAFAAVSEPVEGTMLTVIRDVARGVAEGSLSQAGVPEVLDRAVQVAIESVDHTPDLLEVLRENGVVDSGALGVAVFLQGMRRGMGDSVPEHSQSKYIRSPVARDAVEGPKSRFGFCTEFIVSGARLPVPEVRQRFRPLGDSLVIAGGADRLRVHLHCDDPGAALTAAISVGDLHDVSVRNMDDQHEQADREPLTSEPASPGIVAFASGDGFSSILESLGVTVRTWDDAGGESLAEVVREALATCAESALIVLPNNPEIAAILPASRVTDGKTVHMVPALDSPSGIAAVMAYQFGETIWRNLEAMSAAAQQVTVIPADSDESVLSALSDSDQEAGAPDRIATVYYGREVDPGEVARIGDLIAGAARPIECDLVYGGQTDHRYLVALE